MTKTKGALQEYDKMETLADLRATNYRSVSIKTELRNNLIEKLKNNENAFPGIIGFQTTVIPDVQRAILSRHNILLLGLRGQAKTRIARLLVNLLDEYIPAIAGIEIYDDPLSPLTLEGRQVIESQGEETPIQWIHRSKRYVEKLATPDVSVADLIGDIDPIKAATLKLPYSDERVIHFGLIPRAHRSIFVINELPDLQARIQVSLFNILQERDIQIRGFKLRLPLDIQFVFTANPEDYTNRGSIVTPLKDRIESQIITHYPMKIEEAEQITRQESKIDSSLTKKIHIPELAYRIIEKVTHEARNSEYIDEKSGVSARMSISALENLVSTAERRMILNNEKNTTVRLTDLWGIIPAITGKVELLYEGEQEGPYRVVMLLISEVIKQEFERFFEDPLVEGNSSNSPYLKIKEWFNSGNFVELLVDDSNQNYQKKLESVDGLVEVKSKIDITVKDRNFFMELVLNGMGEMEIISKEIDSHSQYFKDPLANIFDELGDLGIN